MLTARIMVALCPPIFTQAASETIRRATETASRPTDLCFAVPHAMQGALENPPEGIVYYDAVQELCGLVPHLREETHFLFLTGPHAFARGWDSALLALSRKYGRQALFTSSITPCAAESVPTADQPQTRRISTVSEVHADKPVTAQAHLPALKDVQEDGNALIGRGLAVVCAAEPVRTMVIDPNLLFGPVRFLMEDAPLTRESLSLSAYLTGFAVYALHEAPLWPVTGQPRSFLRLPPADTLPGTTLARFEQLLGFHDGQRRCDAKTAMGLFGPEETYPQHMPHGAAFRAKARSARMKLFEMHMPLMVSAYIDLPNPRVSAAFYLLRFGFLRRIQSLPLVLYTGGSQERALRAQFPHTQSYPENSLLPKELRAGGLKPAEAFARSKVLLMERAAKRQVEFTHAAWVDMDILPHPVCTDAVPNFDALMDDRIHIATVKGVPDPSFMVIPVEMLPMLSRLAVSITQLDAELKRGFAEPLLWERIYQKKPQWFALHPMPKRRMLFLTAFDQRLVSRSLQPFLTDLPKPFREGDKQTEKEKSIHV